MTTGPAPDPQEDGRAEPAGSDGPAPSRRKGLSLAGADQFSLADAIGGPRGAAESLVPALVFLVCFTITHDLSLSVILAVGCAALAVLARAVTRSNPTQALSGAVGVAVCALVAMRTGEAKDFYLPGFVINIGYGLVFAASLLPLPALTIGGRRQPAGSYPVVGLLVGVATGEGLSWRSDPARRRVMVRATMLWVAFYAARLVAQVPLYLGDRVQALGTARLVMGIPLFAFMVWLTWRMVRAVPRTVPTVEKDPP